MFRSLLTCALLASGTVYAAEPATVVASDGWVRVLPGNLPAGGYVTLRNETDRAVSIVSASSPDYADAMIHRSSTEGGMGRMEMVDSVPLPPSGKVTFAPGGYHVMLMQAKHPVKPGDAVSVTFTLSDGSKVPVTLTARPANATGP
ncbi:copper chaperone PCu(A)C [Luteibacter flocculans]|uniref:Copper chaperone PCu(A)C n=1 Tax=Luteibacter flocculans TaxID=2780091 RepID=A0ABY4T923_9GAMM|nr:copper chaperone PCu(A)C [Luteibacter flocculans]URL59379.1 copper chaperone PCu(A)C [Luteibacter flocculans]